jgi:hypothetical protein
MHGEMRNGCNILVESLKGRDHLEDPFIDWMILKLVLRK